MQALPETDTAAAIAAKWTGRTERVQTLPENRNSKPSQNEEATTKMAMLCQYGNVQWKMMKKTRRLSFIFVLIYNQMLLVLKGYFPHLHQVFLYQIPLQIAL